MLKMRGPVRSWMILGAYVIAAGAVFWAVERFATHTFTIASEALQMVIALLGVGAAVTSLIVAYLQHGAVEATALAAQQVQEQISPKRPSIEMQQSAVSILEARLGTLESRLAAQVLPLTDQERASLVREISDQLATAEIKNKLDELAVRLGEVFNKDRTLETLERNSVASLARLNSSIPDLSKRANLNLAIGVATTLIGVGVLAVAVFTPPSSANSVDASAYLAHFLPRLSLAVLIEVFAYFFLRLYKDNLDSAAFLRNEMTSIEVSRTALATAILTSDKGAVAQIATALAMRKASPANADQKGRDTISEAEGKAAVELVEKVVALLRPKAG